MEAIEPMLLDNFELTAKNIHSIAIDDLHALSVSVRWQHRANDWRLLLELGQGIAALDEIGRIVGSAMWFPYSPDVAMVGMVITSPRLQAHGAGRWLMQQVMTATGDRELRLYSTAAAYRLYRSLDFVEESIVHHLQGEVSNPGDALAPASHGSVRPLAPGDLPALVSLDAAASGVERRRLIAKLAERSRGTVLEREGRIVAYALCRRSGRGHAVGPLIAASDADAIAVMAPLIRDHADAVLRVDTGCMAGDFGEYLHRSGLGLFDSVTKMSLGAEPSTPRSETERAVARTYCLASQSLG